MLQRLKKFYNYLESSKLIRNQQDFVDRIGSNKTTVSQILNGRRQITKQFVSLVCTAFPFVSEDFLLYGSGSMLIGDGDPVVSLTRGVPYYDVDFVAGFDLVYNNQSVYPSFFVDYKPFNSADFWVNVIGSSMSPLISSGDMVALRVLKDWRSSILYGEVYALVTDSYRTIKKVRRSSLGDEYLLLVPINPDFDSQDIPCSIVLDVFQILGVTKRLF